MLSLLFLLAQIFISVYILYFLDLILVGFFFSKSAYVCVCDLNPGPDYETQFDSECWPHCQSHQWVREETRLRFLPKTRAYQPHDGMYMNI